MAPRNVLVTAASRRVALVHAFQRAVREKPEGGRVVVTDVNPTSPAVYFGDAAYQVPLADEAGYVDALLEICAAESIHLLVPTIDDELPVLAEARPRFEAIGVQVAVSDRRTAEICNDKHATCEYLRAQGVPAAWSWLPAGVPAPPPLPLFVKPRNGRGGIGAFAARSARELEFFLGYVDQPVVQEFLAGREYTIDLLCDFSGRPLSVVPRERVVIRAGVTDRGRTVADPRLVGLAVACAGALSFRGAVNIQCRLVEGVPIVFEINPRFSGGIPLTIAAGADFPRMLLDLATGVFVPATLGRFREGIWMTSYESGLFVPDAALQVALSGLPIRERPAHLQKVA